MKQNIAGNVFQEKHAGLFQPHLQSAGEPGAGQVLGSYHTGAAGPQHVNCTDESSRRPERVLSSLPSPWALRHLTGHDGASSGARATGSTEQGNGLWSK